MKKVKLRMKEQNYYEVIKNVVEKGGNKNRAALKLNISLRHLNRLITKYKEKGKLAFVHGNRSRKPGNTKDVSFSNEIILLYLNKYQDCNFAHFTYLLSVYENINVSYFYVYTTLMRNGITSPKTRRSTKRKLAKEKLRSKNTIVEENELDLMASHEVALEDSHPRKERSKYVGELLQIDASNHRWFANTKTHLHLAIDDASGIVVGGYFTVQETLEGYYNVFKQILCNYGIPYGFLADNRTIFNYKRAISKTADKDVLTQFSYACKRLGTNLETTSVCQEKGRIERTFGTFQGRLVQELRINGINSIQEANNYLNNVFILEFNRLFALPINNFDSVFETSPTPEEINYTLAVLAVRKIDKGNSLRFNNNYFQPYKDNKLVCFKAHTESLVIKAFDGTLLVSIDDIIYNLRKLERNTKVSLNFDLLVEPFEKPKKKHTPPMSHPWKAESFRRYLKSLEEASSL